MLPLAVEWPSDITTRKVAISILIITCIPELRLLLPSGLLIVRPLDVHSIISMSKIAYRDKHGTVPRVNTLSNAIQSVPDADSENRCLLLRPCKSNLHRLPTHIF